MARAQRQELPGRPAASRDTLVAIWVQTRISQDKRQEELAGAIGWTCGIENRVPLKETTSWMVYKGHSLIPCLWHQQNELTPPCKYSEELAHYLHHVMLPLIEHLILQPHLQPGLLHHLALSGGLCFNPATKASTMCLKLKLMHSVSWLDLHGMGCHKGARVFFLALQCCPVLVSLPAPEHMCS